MSDWQGLDLHRADPVHPGTSLVSICIPTFNRERYIDEALDSALAQTYDPVEVIVVDDASTDATVDRVRRRRDPRIRLEVNTRRLGQNGNRNRSVALARGPLVKFLDSDDYLAQDCVARMTEVFARDEAVGVVFCRRQILVDNEASAREAAWVAEHADLHRHFGDLREVNDGRSMLKEWIAAGLRDNWIGEPTAVMARRGHLACCGAFSRHIRQTIDSDLWVRLLARSRVGFVDETLVTYRFGHESEHSANDRARGDWLDRLWTLETLVADDPVRKCYPELMSLLRSERRQAWRTAARLGYPPGSSRVPLRPYLNYARMRALSALGMRPALHATVGGEPAA